MLPKVPSQQNFAPSPGPTPSGEGFFFIAIVYRVVAFDTQLLSLPAEVQKIESLCPLVHKSQSDIQKVSSAPVEFILPSTALPPRRQSKSERLALAILLFSQCKG
jgi:hypothetical protein